MEDQEQVLLHMKAMLRAQEDHIAIPIEGGETTEIKGEEITDLKVHDNGALIAITDKGRYYLIPTYDGPDEMFEDIPFADQLQRISEGVMANVNNVTDVDYSKRILTFANGHQQPVDDLYWEEFLKAYKGRLLQ